PDIRAGFLQPLPRFLHRLEITDDALGRLGRQRQILGLRAEQGQGNSSNQLFLLAELAEPRRSTRRAVVNQPADGQWIVVCSDLVAVVVERFSELVLQIPGQDGMGDGPSDDAELSGPRARWPNSVVRIGEAPEPNADAASVPGGVDDTPSW